MVLSTRRHGRPGAKCRPLRDHLICCGLLMRWSSAKPGVRGDDGEIKQKLHDDQLKIVNHLDDLTLEVDGIKGILPTLATNDDIARLEREQASLEQVFGMTHQVMVGHVEQLTRQYEYL